MINALKKEIKKYPKRSVLTLILLFTLLAAFVVALFQHAWVYMLYIVIISVVICLPVAAGKFYKIDIPLPLSIFAVVYIYAALFLGSLNNYYAKFWWWDVVLHTSSGLAFGIIGFFILYVLYRTKKIRASPKMVAMFSFTFALAIGTLWEIFEFTADSIFGMGMQVGNFFGTSMLGGNLADTMKDLINDSIGALFSAAMSYLYLKRDSGIVFKPMVKEFKKDNPRFFKKRKSK